MAPKRNQKPAKKRKPRPAVKPRSKYDEPISLYPLNADDVVARLLGTPPITKPEKPDGT